MATNITLKPPGRFDFRHPDEWPKWKRRFTQYLAATGLDQEGDVRKVSTLLYCMGEEGDDVLTSTNISAANRKKFDTVLNKFDSFFDVRENVIYERAKFNQRNQAEGESAEQYITALYSLVDNCNYGALKEEMLRDRLVVGIKDKTMSQKLQMMADLTLEKAKKEIRQKEAVCEQQQELQAGVNKPCNNLDEVKQKPQSRYKISKRGQHYKPQSNGGGARLPKQSQASMRCGKPYHSAPNKCPALSSTCFKCHRKGHYGSQCKSKTMAEVEVSTDEEEIFLGAVTSKKDNTWTVTVQLQQKDIQFKMDTGAEVTVISDKVYNSLPEVQLSKPTKTLYGPARQKLDVMGQFTGILTHGNHTHSENIFVVRDLQTNLLGLPSITSLQLIQRIDATLSETMTIIQEQFPKVFTGISQHIAQIVQQCVECAKYATHNKEPLITTQLPEYPWQIVGTDLFEIDKTYYLLIVDYFSRYPEVFQLKSTTSTMVINVMKQVFSRHGIPEIVRSDNGPQYASLEFAEFSSSYDFQHITSSPKYPQSNGEAERMVQTIKRMLKKPQEMYMALLSYRSTPLPWCGLSPAELCMGRRLRTSIPQATKQMMPEWQYLEEFREKNKEYKKTQKHNFDKRHRTRDLPEIPEGSQVWIKSEKQPIEGTVLSSAGQPRSYVVDTPTGQLHRNRSHLKIIPQQSGKQKKHPKRTSKVIITRSRAKQADTGKGDVA